MVNQSETTPILLEGRGFKALDTGDYKEGEFRQLSNVEMKEGRLVGRRNIKSCFMGSGTPLEVIPGPGTTDSGGFIGLLDKWAISAGRTFQTAVSSTGVVPMWNPSVLNDGLTGSQFAQLEGFFKYNYINYWLQLKLSGLGITFKLLYKEEFGNDNPSDYTYAMLNSAGNQITIGPTDRAYRDYEHNNFFIFKDRLWICNSDGIYFSRATDPTKFATVDDGGFFKFPDTRVNFALAIKDTIYLLCDSSVYAVTYNLSPNEDATIRKISEVVGGTHGCVFRDQVYFINNEAIFSINNNFAEKVIENKFDTGDNSYDRQRLTAWREYIVVNKSYTLNPLGITPDSPTGVFYNYYLNSTFKYKIGATTTPYGVSYVSFCDITSPIVSNYLELTRGTLGDSYLNNIEFGTNSADGFRLSIDPNTQYTFKYKLKPVVFPDTFHSRSGRGILFYYSASNTYISSQFVYTGDIHDTSEKDISGTFVTPENAVSVRFVFRISIEVASGGPAPAWFASESYRFYEVMLVKGDGVGVTFFNGDSTFADANYSYLGLPESSSSIKSNSGISYSNYLIPYFDKEQAQLAGNDLGTNLIYLNMDNGSVHTVDFRDKFVQGYYGLQPGPYFGYISDVIFNPNINESTQDPTLMFMTNRVLAPSTNLYANYFYMENEYSDFPYDSSLWDLFLEGRQFIYRWRPNYVIELYGFAPDGTEYNTKKFRNLEIMGKFPNERFNLGVAYDDLPYGNAISLSDVSVSGSYRPHYPHRIGLNQRANSISLLLFENETDIVFGDRMIDINSTYDKLEISQMQLLWTPTLRTVSSRSTT